MCAIVGVFGNSKASKIASMALFAMQHRGQESTGISVSFENKIKTIKGRGLVDKIFNKNTLDKLNGDMAIGHNRYSTAGKDSILDAQPIFARYKLGEISIVHNGNLTNKDSVRDKLIEGGSIFHTDMDTENMIHLIAKSTQNKLQYRIEEALGTINGAYCFNILSRSKIFVIRDRYGIRPLSLGKLKDGGYIVASETCAFDLVDAQFVRDIEPGEMLIFTHKKPEPISIQLFKKDPHYCAFEYIYFARPDSLINGKNVYSIRQKLGTKLANIAHVEADMVVPVPDSGIPSALGYSKQSKIPFEMAIIRNHYIGRTFIEPTQEQRSQKVKMKLSTMKHLIEGKILIVVDDSIVRGTTSKSIINMLRMAGAKEIHFRVASPMIKFPCYYGIDTPKKDELICNQMSIDEIIKYLNVDSLAFLNIDDVKSSIGNENNYSLVSFDGNYFIKN
jgi:amidophosphoribosyltransferase